MNPIKCKVISVSPLMVREINPLAKPDRFNFDSYGDKENPEYLRHLEKYDRSEQNLKTYSILQQEQRDAVKEIKASKVLGELMSSNMKLYEEILDTPGFAFHFNELVKLAMGTEQPRKLQGDGDVEKLADEYAAKKHLSVKPDREDWIKKSEYEDAISAYEFVYDESKEDFIAGLNAAPRGFYTIEDMRKAIHFGAEFKATLKGYPSKNDEDDYIQSLQQQYQIGQEVLVEPISDNEAKIVGDV